MRNAMTYRFEKKSPSCGFPRSPCPFLGPAFGDSYRYRSQVFERRMESYV